MHFKISPIFIKIERKLISISFYINIVSCSRQELATKSIIFLPKIQTPNDLKQEMNQQKYSVHILQTFLVPCKIVFMFLGFRGKLLRNIWCSPIIKLFRGSLSFFLSVSQELEGRTGVLIKGATVIILIWMILLMMMIMMLVSALKTIWITVIIIII